MENEHQFNLNIGIPNGIILTLIGILVLVTPLFTDLSPCNILVDIIAGIILTVGGGLSMFIGIRKMKKNSC